MSLGTRFAALKQRRGRWALAALAALACLMGWRIFFGGGTVSGPMTTTVRRGPMTISVAAGGSVEALESQEIRCEVQGETKILSIVEEGYFITPEDVEKGKVLIQLDAKKLLDQQVEDELRYQNAKASFTQAREQYEIQINQNESDMKTAELAAKFARMDMFKYLGDKLAKQLIDELDLDEAHARALAPLPVNAPTEEELSVNLTKTADNTAPLTAAAAPPAEAANGSGTTATAIELAVNATPAIEVNIDFSKFANEASLGDGEARQLVRTLEDKLTLSQGEISQARSKLSGTERLFEKEFVTKNDLEQDQMAQKRAEVNVASAETSKELYIKYEFPKMSEKMLSDYIEKLRALERARKLAVSKLAQAEANLNSAEAQFTLQTRKRKETQDQIAKCTLHAEKPGLVVYGSGSDRWYGNERIEEGASVRERQTLITIPDTTTMAVEVKIHESYVKQIKKGQRATMTVDAFPDIVLTGSVHKLAVLPDSQNRWMNPDMKVYPTKLVIEGTYEWLKPGMSASAEIVVEEVPDVLQVPLQAVSVMDGEKVCFVKGLGEPEKRIVKTGRFNDTAVEIADGLHEGETVLLRAPLQPNDQSGPKEQAKKEADADTPPKEDGAKQKGAKEKSE